MALGIAAWERRKASHAEGRMSRVLSDLPRQVATQLNAQLKKAEPQSTVDRRGVFETSYADVDGDGNDELLVQFPAGAHGSALAVFGFRNFNLELIGELGVGTP